jgi:hypothetical protein
MKVAILLALLGTAAACGGTTQGGGFGEGDDAGPSGHVPFLAQDSGAPRGAGVHDASVSDAGTPDTSAFDATASDDSSIEVDSGSQVDTGAAVTSADGFGPSRTACINKINALRATDTAVALQPYTLQTNPTLDTCVDTQATNDAAMNSPHYSYINSAPACTWGTSLMMGNSGQDECAQGYGTTPAGIEQCLQDMWDERLQSNCAGCVGCTQPGGACPNCDFYGMNGPECGHYVNMSAPYYTTVACGFGGQAPSSGTAWAVQDFE